MSSTTGKKKILRTRLCDMLGIEYPIISAGMGTVSGPTLTAAVSNAGGLGVLAGIDLDADRLRQWIRKTKALTDKPFGVDTIFIKALPEEITLDELRAKFPAEAIRFTREMEEEIGVPHVEGKPPDCRIMSRKNITDQFQACVDEGVPIIVSALGNPDWLLPEMHARGMKVLGLVGNVKEARRVAQTGVDFIIAQGYEAGGHTGRIGSMALIPQVADAVYPVPVVAAGGIADGRGLVAALALGTIGVWCGTAFAVSKEASVDHVEAGIYPQWEIDLRKQKILQATEDDARVTMVVTGKPCRNVRNKFVQTWEQKDGPYLTDWPAQSALVADLQESVRREHKNDYVSWIPAGQISGMLTEMKSARQIVDDMVAGAIEILGEKFPREVDIGR
ncbi:NAD(P)H-dependent flavin oxidoreductase [Chloroflexota bacterium]